MKRSFFLNKVLVIGILFCALGCSNDTDISDSVSEEIEVKRLRRVKTMEVLIVYAKGTGETAKRKIRQQYIDIKLLLDVEQCDLEYIETWIVNQEMFMLINFKEPPLDIITTQNEPVERIILNMNCIKYKGY